MTEQPHLPFSSLSRDKSTVFLICLHLSFKLTLERAVNFIWLLMTAHSPSPYRRTPWISRDTSSSVQTLRSVLITFNGRGASERRTFCFGGRLGIPANTRETQTQAISLCQSNTRETQTQISRGESNTRETQMWVISWGQPSDWAIGNTERITNGETNDRQWK